MSLSQASRRGGQVPQSLASDTSDWLRRMSDDAPLRRWLAYVDYGFLLPGQSFIHVVSSADPLGLRALFERAPLSEKVCDGPSKSH